MSLTSWPVSWGVAAMPDTPQYLRDLVDLHREGVLPPGIHRVEVRHDHDCDHWRGRPCSCRPDLIAKTLGGKDDRE